MKKYLLAACIAALFIAPAVAADFPVKAAAPLPISPIYNWSGIYLGINGGGGQSRNCWDMKGFNVPVAGIVSVSNSVNVAEGCNDGTGGVVGGQIGYRYQLNNFVFGIEGQGDWADFKGSNRSSVFNGVTIPGIGVSLNNQTKVDAIGMFTGQVGYSFGPLLWYVKGGAAITDNKYDGALTFTTSPPQFVATSLTATDHASEIKFGGVVGTGLDWMFAPGWSVGAEYSHLFMGSRDVGFAYTGVTGTPNLTLKNPAGVPSRNDSISQDIDMATVRLNYSFGAH